MNIGNANFPILSPQQANPTFSALKDAIQRHLMMQQSKQNSAILPYVGPQAEANLQQTQLGNQRSEAILPYAGPQASADLLKTQLANQFYGPNAQSEIDFRNQQTLAEKIANEFLPQMQQADISQKLAQADYYQHGGGRLDAGQKKIEGLKRQIEIENPDFDERQINEAASAYLNGSDSLSDGTKLPEASGIVNALTDQIVKTGNTAAGLNQQRYAATLDTAFNNADKLKDSAFKFAGIGGQAKLQAAKAAAAAGQYDPDYQDYLNFTRQTIPALASEIIRTGGANSTDQQKLLALQQINPVVWDSNPELAKKQFDYLEGLYKDISKTIAQSPTQIRSGLKKDNRSSGVKKFKRVNGQLVMEED
jgi:hypothetical protein